MPACLPPLPAGAPRNRLGLARWLASPENPLTARVDRQPDLAALFRHRAGQDGRELRRPGRAAVAPRAARLAGDRARPHGLGRQGDAQADRHQRDLPAGVAARRRRWSRATRRTGCWRAGRGSGCRPRWCATTPWRSPACWSTRIGGPSVKPYQPAGLWEELAGGAGEGPYVQDKGPNLYRRSLYVYRKRTVPHPALATFDAPSREICQVKRPRTNTPLQALELLNDVTYVEAARQLAQLALDDGGSSARGADHLSPSAARLARDADARRARRPAARARALPARLSQPTASRRCN